MMEGERAGSQVLSFAEPGALRGGRLARRNMQGLRGRSICMDGMRVHSALRFPGGGAHRWQLACKGCGVEAHKQRACLLWVLARSPRAAANSRALLMHEHKHTNAHTYMHTARHAPPCLLFHAKAGHQSHELCTLARPGLLVSACAVLMLAAKQGSRKPCQGRQGHTPQDVATPSSNLPLPLEPRARAG